MTRPPPPPAPEGDQLPVADRAWRLLADGLTPPEVVARLAPPTRDDAVRLARRLPLLAGRPAADRGAALARLAARAGMRRFRLFLTPDGRVADDPAYNRPDDHAAGVTLAGDGCTVLYTARSFSDRDHFQFLGPPSGEPDRFGVVPRHPIPLSPTGYWSHYADPDAVTAMGGAEAYLAALSAAGRDGREAFERGFTGPDLEPTRRARKPVVGPHTARAAGPPARLEYEPEGAPDQEPPGSMPGRLF